MGIFDVVVIGGGHAGCEAAHAAARLGCKTLLVTFRLDRIGFLSCNPAMGGLAKGQLIKEVDALGGIIGRITDQSAIQYRQLNESKGPAVRATRVQCDKALYAQNMQQFLQNCDNLTLISAEVEDICVQQDQIQGIILKGGAVVSAKTVVLTAGTFMQAVMYTGFSQSEGGRVGDSASALSDKLKALGLRCIRLKTGTPPRLHKDSIDYAKTTEQTSDLSTKPFSFYQKLSRFPYLPQISCHITYTNALTHELIAANFDKSPMFTGLIKGLGPRYCPSIEDKVKRFADKSRHQIFLEPEGLDCDEVYVNGISTSLPQDVQERFVRSIEGLEKAHFLRHGYAVEYDAIDARQLRLTYESKDIEGLFFAGQVNGTSGYEEAAAQGLIAGINAAHQVQKKPAFELSRFDGYIGVLADDLVLKGADEPYRMFTSRAEYRLLLREDNADLRLSEKGYQIGLLGEKDYLQFEKKRQDIQTLSQSLKAFALYPTEKTNRFLEEKSITGLKDKVLGDVFMRRPEVSWPLFLEMGFSEPGYNEEVKEQVEIQIKYEGYIKRDTDLFLLTQKNEMTRLPIDLNYDSIAGLSQEIRQRLKQTRPVTLGQMSRLQGVTPAAVASILIFLRSQKEEFCYA
jgi:tRNA uridine 5-carboxymethylaminomethyl modification enzyme